MRRALQWMAALSVMVLACAATWIGVQLHRAPPLEPYAALNLPVAAPAANTVSVRFGGVSTLLFDDGETAWMTDGFFSRPSFWRMLTMPIGPDLPRIEQGLHDMGVQRLAAVVVMHSHYDHAMDAPIVAQRTGARLIGAADTMHIGRGLGLTPAQMQTVEPLQTIQLGKFSLQFIASRHSPTPYSDGHSPEHITHDVVPPQRAFAWREGQVWSLWVRHENGRSWLIQGSAGFLPGALRHVQADTVFLGTGNLGKKDPAYRAALWRETVQNVGAKQVIPIHWDNFWRPLDEPLQAMPYLLDDFASSMQDLQARAAQDHVQLSMPQLFAPFSP